MSAIFDVALGKVAAYAELSGATDSLIVVPLLAGEIDDDLRLHTTLSAVLAANTESSIGRLTATSTTVASGVASLTTANNGWIAPTSGPEVVRLVVCYVPASTSTDADTVPLVSLDVAFTPNGIHDNYYTFDPFFTATDAGAA